MTSESTRSGPELRAAVLEALDNQLRDNDPPETRATYERLRGQGIDRDEARRLLGCVVATEIFEVLKTSRPFDRVRFVERLTMLPAMEWMDDQGGE